MMKIDRVEVMAVAPEVQRFTWVARPAGTAHDQHSRAHPHG